MSNKSIQSVAILITGFAVFLIILLGYFGIFYSANQAQASCGSGCFAESFPLACNWVGDCRLALNNKCYQDISTAEGTNNCYYTPTCESIDTCCETNCPIFPSGYTYNGPQSCTGMGECGTCLCTVTASCGVSCDDLNPDTCGDTIGCDAACRGGPCLYGPNPSSSPGASPTPTPTPTGGGGGCTGTLTMNFPWGTGPINVGQQTAFNATYDPDGAGPQEPVSGNVCFGETWTSDNPSIAYQDGVTCPGNIAYYTGSNPGTTNARVSINSCIATTPITVNAPPTLSVALSATPSSGTSPLNSVLSADVSGTATGTINYSFWWNCANTSNSVSTVETACGTLPAPASGSCSSNAVGYKCNAVNTDPQSTSARSYVSNSTAKVIAERGAATPAEARTQIIITNSPPTVISVTTAPPDYCASGPAAFVSWTYSDPDGNPQSAYQVQVDDQSSFNSPEVDSGKILSGGASYFTGNGVPPWAWDTTYKARVRVWDSLDTVSAWKESGSWKTPKHAYPLVNFTWSPLLNPSANQLIQFSDLTTFYDAGGVGQRGWEWAFGDGAFSTLQNPSHTYSAFGTYSVTDDVTDKDGYACSLTKPINIERPIPVWKEVSPK